MTLSDMFLLAMAVVAKGIAMAIILHALGVSFLDQIVVASASAVITGIFVVVAAVITAKGMRTTRNEVTSTKHEVEHVRKGLGIEPQEEEKGEEIS